ncbi:hypothetical protein [Flavisolibacter tropicus]|nr:hypothetical protein [Flavisolibacter tropicus]
MPGKAAICLDEIQIIISFYLVTVLCEAFIDLLSTIQETPLFSILF